VCHWTEVTLDRASETETASNSGSSGGGGR